MIASSLSAADAVNLSRCRRQLHTLGLYKGTWVYLARGSHLSEGRGERETHARISFAKLGVRDHHAYIERAVHR